MSKKKLAYVGLALVLLGVLAFVYGGVGYTRQEREMELGSFDANVEMPEKHRLPLWGSGVLLAAGLSLVVVGLRRR